MTLDDGACRRPHVTIVPPPPDLADLAEFSWIDRGPPCPDGGRGCRVLPDHAPHLIWHLDSAGRRRVAVIGARTRYVDVSRANRRWTVGIRLRPGALPCLFRHSAAEFTDVPVAVEDLLHGRSRARWREIDETASPETARRDLTRFLLAFRAVRHTTIAPRIRHLAEAPVNVLGRVGAYATSLGITDRTLRSLSRAQFGMGLKRLLRVRRLHAALALRIDGRESRWSRVAAAAGYADQAHLIRDFHDLVGETPGAFLRRAD